MQKYLFCHDYGMGGLWLYINANDPYEVIRRYPYLTYIKDKPPWLYEMESSKDDKAKPLQVFNID